MASLLLKWGSVKGWNNMNEDQIDILQRWHDEGVCASAALQRDSDKQKAIILELIDTMKDGEIYNDWDGAYYTKEQARDYILNYGKKESA